jgi:hypothetical protein
MDRPGFGLDKTDLTYEINCSADASNRFPTQGDASVRCAHGRLPWALRFNAYGVVVGFTKSQSGKYTEKKLISGRRCQEAIMMVCDIFH